MSITIGRVVCSEDPYNMQVRGDRWSFSLDIAAASVAACQAMMSQLSGYLNNDDEPTIPVIWTEDTTFSGFYSVVGMSLAPVSVYLANGFCPVTIELVKAVGFSNPLFEVVTTQVKMTTAFLLPAAGAPANRVAVPGANLIESNLNFFAGGTFSQTRVAEDGTTQSSTGPWSSGVTTAGSFQWATSPDHYYDGGCKFEQSYGGTYYPMPGVQVLPVSSPWRISNGLIRAWVDTGGQLWIQMYDGTVWDPAVAFTLGAAAVTLSSGNAVRVIRNSPEQVIVRVSMKLSAVTSNARNYLDINLRRGLRGVTCYFSSNSGPLSYYIKPTTGVACTATTGGFIATAADVSGNKLVLGSNIAHTDTLATGVLTLTAAGFALPFFLGYELNADATGPQFMNESIMGTTERQRLVVR